jgi:Glycosyl hydrolases family 28/Bacterial Ig-like domain (group 3)
MSQTYRFTRAAALALPLLFASTRLLCAQDTRNVSEPKFPASCAVLQAKLSVSNGEPSSETEFDTSRIQDALDSCASGKAVELAATDTNYGFLIQPISIPSGVTLLVDAGVTVFASRNPADYQQGNGAQCGEVSTDGGGCTPLITSKRTTGSGIMGYGVIDGRGWDKLIVNGSTQSYSWYSNTQKAYIPRPVLNQNNFDMVELNQANNFTIYKITLLNSPEFNIHWYGQNGGTVTSGLTIWGLKIISPNNISNTDGIDPTDNSQNVTITDSFISNGDDNVAISSTEQGNPVSNVSITNTHTYAGFGISIGSRTQGGINNVLVDTVSQAGYYPNTGSAGLKIKSSSDRGGVVNNVTYQHICMQNERFAIRIYPYYTNPNTTANVPTYTNIKVHDVTVLADSSGSSGRFVFQGYNANHMTTLWLDNLNVMGTPDTSSNAPQNVAITLAGPVNPSALQQLNGTGVSYAGSASASSEAPYPCSTSNFQQITGELLLSTGNGTNLQSLSVSPSDSFTLNAVVQPATAESAALSKPITFYDGATAVGTAAITGNGTLATLSLSNVSSGTHKYTAQYPADSNYSSFSFGSVTVNVSGSTTAPPPANQVPTFTVAATPASLQVAAGSSVTTTLAITPVDGFTGPVTVTCSSPVASITCTVTSPAPISGTSPSMATATIVVAASTPAVAFAGHMQTRIVVAAVFPLAAFLLLPLANRRRRSMLFLIVLAGVALCFTGCSTPQGVVPTVTAGTITFTSTSGSIVVTTPVKVTTATAGAQ